MFKILLIINLLLILASLFSGAIFLVRDDSKSNRIVTSLTIRILLSVCLICLLLIGYYTGNLRPHSI